jgi:hypothetical protein
VPPVNITRTGFWDTWLLIVALGMAVFGVLMALFNRTAAFESFNRQIDTAFWWTVSAPQAARAFASSTYGVWGASVAGFGLLAAFVVRSPYRQRQIWAMDAMTVSVLAWFVLDTAISLGHAVWFNVGLNLLILIALAPPLLATWRQFGRA